MPTIEEYKAIAAEYKGYLSPTRNISVFSSNFRSNLFTSIIYRGDFSSTMFRDWLAGGVKNSFFFGLFPKSEHANFFSVIDRICKLDRCPEKLLAEIEESPDQNFNSLVNLLIEYFLKVQQQFNDRLIHFNTHNRNVSAEYNRNILKKYYAKTLRNLKKDINNLAQQHGVLRRIKKEDSKEEEIIYSHEELNHNYYEDMKYIQKINNRKIATFNRRLAKVIASLAAVAEIFVNYVAVKGMLALFHVPLVLLSPWTLLVIPFAIAGLYSHYHFYRNDIYDGLKDRGHKKTNEDSEKISCGKNIGIKVVSFLSLGGGFCGWALTSYSVSMTVMGMLCTSGMLLAFPFAAALAFGLTFVYYRNIGKAIKNLGKNVAEFKEYIANIKSIEDVPRVAADIVILIIAIAFMVAIGIAGYYLFRGKGVTMLTTWKICNEASAFIVSGICSAINSIVKGLFGIKKIRELANQFIDWIKSSEPVNPPDSIDLNPVQIADQKCTTICKWLSYLSVILNAGAKGMLYGSSTAGEKELQGVGAWFAYSAGGSDFFYMSAPTAVATGVILEKNNVQISGGAALQRFSIFSTAPTLEPEPTVFHSFSRSSSSTYRVNSDSSST